jgi:hypothetical protein
MVCPSLVKLRALLCFKCGMQQVQLHQPRSQDRVCSTLKGVAMKTVSTAVLQNEASTKRRELSPNMQDEQSIPHRRMKQLDDLADVPTRRFNRVRRLLDRLRKPQVIGKAIKAQPQT